jgi:SAM-dependent methyltransferase
MDINSYYLKYIKYKTKYTKLKQIGGDDTDYLEELRTLYPECKHDTYPLKHGDDYREKGYITTYGEMTYNGIKKLYNRIKKLNDKFNSDNNIDTFLDVGSGRGLLPLYMAVYVKKSIGVELAEERVNDARHLKELLSTKFPEEISKVEFFSCDIFDYFKDKTKMSFTPNILVWISNLCFTEDITKKLFDELNEKMPIGTIICCSKIPNTIPNGIELLMTIVIEMSWSKYSTVYCYRKVEEIYRLL